MADRSLTNGASRTEGGESVCKPDFVYPWGRSGVKTLLPTNSVGWSELARVSCDRLATDMRQTHGPGVRARQPCSHDLRTRCYEFRSGLAWRGVQARAEVTRHSGQFTGPGDGGVSRRCGLRVLRAPPASR